MSLSSVVNPANQAVSRKGPKPAQFSKKREVLGLLLTGLGLFVVLAVVSYHPWDRSLNAASAARTANWAGPVGAYLADVFHQLFGLSAYLMMWLPLTLGVATLLGRSVRRMTVNILAWLLLGIACSMVFELLVNRGGMAGQLLIQSLTFNVGRVGAYIVTLVALGALWVLVFNLSIAHLLKRSTAMAGWGVIQSWALGLRVVTQTQKRVTVFWRARRDDQRRAVLAAAHDERVEHELPVSKNSLDQKVISEKSAPEPLPNPLPNPLPENVRLLPQTPKPSAVSESTQGVASHFSRVTSQLPPLALEDEDEEAPIAQTQEESEVPEEEEAQAPIAQPTLPPSSRLARAVQGPLIVDVRPEAPQPMVEREMDLRRSPSVLNQPFILPAIGLLDYDAPERLPIDRERLVQNARKLERKLKDYGIDGQVVEIRPGPVVTMYEFLPAPGIKISRIASLADDVAMGMEALRVRIVAPIPGKGVVGIEIPNERRETVYLKELISHDSFVNADSSLTLAIGKDIEGKPYSMDLAKCPHLLVAGATGAGKSVSINCIILSLLYRATPEDVRLLMVDPKMLELSIYDRIPHLLLPVVTDPKKASLALRWAVEEMERRYALLSEAGVRNIAGYNKKIETWQPQGAPLPDGSMPVKPVKLPYIVLLIDELADLMMVASKEVETSICRLAQMARAAGIHLILATQRPSVDVLTGVIKANFPARISFQVTSRHDSRTILDGIGAENLLGMGDMLIMPPGTGGITRVHGSYVSEVEIQRVVDFLRQQGKPQYDESILRPREEDEEAPEEESFADELYDQAVDIVSGMPHVSVSLLQRRMRIGYNRSARLIERMEREGVVGPGDGAKPREVLIHKQ